MKGSIQHKEEYLEFLRKRLQSKNYKENASKEEYKKTKAKYNKAKLKLKMMREDAND
jgi:hypothetical protein